MYVQSLYSVYYLYKCMYMYMYIYIMFSGCLFVRLSFHLSFHSNKLGFVWLGIQLTFSITMYIKSHM